MDQAIIFERGDRFYIVGPVAPIQPTAVQMEEFAFAEVVREQSPNEMLMWLRGQYVEADVPNRNGQLWTGDELAIASLTPRLMPVTVMHDPRQAVGLIADTKLLTPDSNQVPRSRIDTALAIWKHRFPEVCEEAAHNYELGTLMQSMECLPGYYACVECGKSYVKMPGGTERANWCEHLRGETAAAKRMPVRRLGNVTFTGTGLIFGSRGARGAFDKAHLDTFREEVAEFHERAKADKPNRRQRRMETIEIPRSEYDELKAQTVRVAELTQRVTGLEETAAKVPQLEQTAEQLEIAKKKAEDDLAAANTKIGEFEETARAATLASDRLGKLGGGFTAKLPDTIKTRLQEQAKALSDDDWTARLEELAEWTQVKPDDPGEAGSGDNVGNGGGQGSGSQGSTFSREETARAGSGGGGGGGGQPSRAATSTVLGGIFDITKPRRPEPAKKD